MPLLSCGAPTERLCLSAGPPTSSSESGSAPPSQTPPAIPDHSAAGKLPPLASRTGQLLPGSIGKILGSTGQLGYSAGSTGRGCSGGILGGIHWQVALTEFCEPLWRDTRRDPLASGILGGIRWSRSGGILSGIHWRAALAGHSGWRAALAGHSVGQLASCSGGLGEGVVWEHRKRKSQHKI